VGQVIYTYDVEWKYSETPWSHRWDVYFTGNPDDEIHYFSIVNSLMIVLFLTGVVAMIMLRTLRRDISNYNEIQTLVSTCLQHEEMALFHCCSLLPWTDGCYLR